MSVCAAVTCFVQGPGLYFHQKTHSAQDHLSQTMHLATGLWMLDAFSEAACSPDYLVLMGVKLGSNSVLGQA